MCNYVALIWPACWCTWAHREGLCGHFLRSMCLKSNSPSKSTTRFEIAPFVPCVKNSCPLCSETLSISFSLGIINNTNIWHHMWVIRIHEPSLPSMFLWISPCSAVRRCLCYYIPVWIIKDTFCMFHIYIHSSTKFRVPFTADAMLLAL